MKETLLTGSSGFLGKIILSSESLGDVITLSRSFADICCDLSREIPVLPVVSCVVHAAGKAHLVPRSPEEEAIFYKVNVEGTRNLLSALSGSKALPERFVLISTVAVYGANRGTFINEKSPLLAKDPYGLSKIQAEKLVTEWCNLNNVICTILRLPLVIGQNPSGNLKSMINGIKKNYYFNIGGGHAKKSMVLATDVAAILEKASFTGGIYNLTDGFHPSFLDLSSHISKQLNRSKPMNLPIWLAIILAKIGDVIGSKSPISTNKLSKIISDLTFDDAKARSELKWNPKPVLQEFIVNE